MKILAVRIIEPIAPRLERYEYQVDLKNAKLSRTDFIMSPEESATKKFLLIKSDHERLLVEYSEYNGHQVKLLNLVKHGEKYKPTLVVLFKTHDASGLQERYGLSEMKSLEFMARPKNISASPQNGYMSEIFDWAVRNFKTFCSDYDHTVFGDKAWVEFMKRRTDLHFYAKVHTREKGDFLVNVAPENGKVIVTEPGLPKDLIYGNVSRYVVSEKPLKH